MPLILKSVQRNDGEYTATYELTHSTPGPAGTTLVLDLVATIVPAGIGPIQMTLNVQGPACGSVNEAIDRMADQLERSAEALRNRPKNWVAQIPVYPE